MKVMGIVQATRGLHVALTLSLLSLSHITSLCPLPPSFPFLPLTSVLTSLSVSLLPCVHSPLFVPCSHLSSPPSPPPICLFPSPLSQIDHAVVASLFTDSRGHETLAASHRQLRGFLIDVDGDVLKELSPEPGKPDKVGSSAIVLRTADAWVLTMTYQGSGMLPFLPHKIVQHFTTMNALCYESPGGILHKVTCQAALGQVAVLNYQLE